MEDLRSQIAALEKELADEEKQLERWSTAEAAVAEVLAEGEDEVAGRGPSADAGSRGPAPVAAAAAQRLVVSAPVMRADGKVLAEANEDVVLALASAGRPLRAKPVCEAVGWDTDHRPVERMRVKLKRLVKQGWLTEDEVGLFAIAPGVGELAEPTAVVDGAVIEDV
ncbi:hypothetical protein [Streptomyces sp. NBC_00212]|uniref:hypothetical protein n=1 Tax=Streptomyces sp. NBC_00212 TaxID=2975684 RepID=UPI003249E326